MTMNIMRLLSRLLCCRFIHLIKETNAGDMVLLCLPPHCECLRLLEDSKQQKRVSSEHAQIRKQCINEKGSIYLWLTSTPAEASNTATAPSRTRSARSTSRVKSTCPVSPHRESCLIFNTKSLYPQVCWFYLGYQWGLFYNFSNQMWQQLIVWWCLALFLEPWNL